MGRSKTLKRLRRQALVGGTDYAPREASIVNRPPVVVERFTPRSTYQQLKRQGRRRP